MKPLMSCPTRYQQAMIAYLQHTDRAEKQYELSSTKIPEAVVAAVGTTPDVFHYLTIGSGMGDSDILALIALRKRYRKIKATIIEPSPDMIAAFKENVRKEGPLLDDVDFLWNAMTLEDYMENEQPKQQFHCIFVVGVVSYLTDLTKCMKYLYKVLDKTGLIAITNGSDKNVFIQISRTYSNLMEGFSTPATEKLVAVFNEVGAHCTVSEMEAKVDIISCMQEDSQIGNLLLDLFTHVANFRETAPRDLVDDVIQFLTNPGLLVHRSNDKVTIRNSQDVILVQRPIE